MLFVCQTVYGYCEVSLSWRCFSAYACLYNFFPFSQKSSLRFQLAESGWRVFRPLSPSDVHSTQFKSNSVSLSSCKKNFCFLSDALSEYDSVSPPLFSPPLFSLSSRRPVSPSHNGLFVDALHPPSPSFHCLCSRTGAGDCGSPYTTRARQPGATSNTGSR